MGTQPCRVSDEVTGGSAAENVRLAATDKARCLGSTQSGRAIGTCHYTQNILKDTSSITSVQQNEQ